MIEHRVDRTLIQPVECHCLQRLGSLHDGGYVVPADAIRRACVLLSFGVATNWTFERGAVEMNPRLRVEAYDPSVGKAKFVSLGLRAAVRAPLRLAGLDPRGALASLRKLHASADYFRFFSGRRRHYRERVWHNRDRGSASVADAIERGGAKRPLSLFAKIDIEGAEYRILPGVCDHAELFTGLVVEFHDTDICAAAFNAQLTQLRDAFEVVHVHGNNYGDLSFDRSLPLSLEITLMSRELFSSAPAPYTGPLPRPGLDWPNDPRTPDYVIRL